MATLIEINALRASPSLLSRFTVAVEKTASTILAEVDNVTNHTERLAWASRCMFEGDKCQRYADVIRKVALHLDANFATDGEAITDASIQSIVDVYAHALALKGL